MECMGVATGCGCKEVYTFPHFTYPYSSCICFFLQQLEYEEERRMPNRDFLLPAVCMEIALL